MDRERELVEQEIRRHRALAMVDTGRRAEHEEVARALGWCLRNGEVNECILKRPLLLCRLAMAMRSVIRRRKMVKKRRRSRVG